MLAVEAGDEAPAADLAARLEPPEFAYQVAPEDGLLLPEDRLAEDDPGPPQELPYDELGPRMGVARVSGEQAPAARHRYADALARRGPDERAEPSVGVARHEAARDQLTQARLELGVEQPRGSRELLGEHRAALGEGAHGLARGAAQGALVERHRRFAAGERRPCLDLVARDEADRRRPHRAGRAPPEPPPGDLPGEGDLVEPFTLVPPDAGWKDARLPRRRR